MDGQQLRKLSVCLLLGAIGCNRNSIQSPWGNPPAGDPVTGVPMVTGSKPFWGSSSQPAVPVEFVTDTDKKGPPKPETLTAVADVQLAAAFDEKTAPTSRESLLDSARQGYQKALQLDPKNKTALLALAHFYTRIGDRDRAMETYNRYMAMNPKDAAVAHKIAWACGSWKDWAGAVAWCDRALQIDPENLSYRKTKAFCLARGGQWEEAFAVLCQIMPEAQARYDLACVLAHQNHLDASRQQLMLALKVDPNYTPARELLAELDQPVGPHPDPNAIQRAGYTQER